MRIDLPVCSFKYCRYCFDCNCVAKGGVREGCQYRFLIETIENVEKEHPYKVPGDYDTYSQYNEAWQDCIGRLMSIIEPD
jgi:hypothetical protein